MSNFFGGGFTAPPNSQCKLRQAQGPFEQQPMGPVRTGPIPTSFPQQQPFTQPMVHLGAAVPPYAPPAPPPPPVHAAQRAVLLPVVQPALQGPMQQYPEPEPARQYVQAPGPMGPRSFPVMKKGEAPCPICRG